MKIESKMTAVEWLQEALEGSILNNEQIMQTIGLFEQAKEMEKQQITEAFDSNYDYWFTADNYYELKFNKCK